VEVVFSRYLLVSVSFASMLHDRFLYLSAIVTGREHETNAVDSMPMFSMLSQFRLLRDRYYCGQLCIVKSVKFIIF